MKAVSQTRGELLKDERFFAALLVAPGLLVLVVTTTAPLVHLLWTSLHQANLSMPWMNRFVGLDHYVHMLGDGRFWEVLRLTAIYTVTTVVLQLVIGLGLALLVLQIPLGQWLFRLVAILPIVLAPVVVGLYWRTLISVAELRPVRRFHDAGVRQVLQLARRADACADLRHSHSHLAVDGVRIPRSPCEFRFDFRRISTRRLGSIAPVRLPASATSHCRSSARRS